MENSHNHIRLTSAEIGHLWSSFLFETSVHHMFRYFLVHVDDPDTATFVEQCLHTSKRHVHRYMDIFKKGHFPVPRGITSEDINTKAPRLFSDVFYLHYIDGMAKFALNGFALAVAEVSRKDVREVFHLHIDALQEITEMGKRLLLEKGLYSRPPYITTPKQVDFVESGHFFAGFTVYKTHLIAYGTANYGLSMALSPRKDLALMYLKVIGEVMTYA